MTMDETIKRINELYHKSQKIGLTEDEQVEQRELRQRYIESIKGNLRGQLENMTIQRPDGTIEKVKKIKQTKSAHRRETENCRTKLRRTKTKGFS